MYVWKIDNFIIKSHIFRGFFNYKNILNPRAGGAKRRARVLIPPGYLFTPGETKALAKSKVHQISRA
jgi:hypothetical protein